MGIYRNIIDNALDMMCVVPFDIRSQILYINKTAQYILQTEPAQLVESNFWDIVHTEEDGAIQGPHHRHHLQVGWESSEARLSYRHLSPRYLCVCLDGATKWDAGHCLRYVPFTRFA